MSSLKPKFSTKLLHGDEQVNSAHGDVAPPISVSTTFKATPDITLTNGDMWNPTKDVYSRYSRDTTTRVQHVLSEINGGYALAYSSGLSAAYAALVHYSPKRIAIRGGYMGFYTTIKTFDKTRGSQGAVQVIDLDDPLQPGDLVWLESPLNPKGTAIDIKFYTDKAHQAGCKVVVDSTFAPPPLQFPFKFGVDCILHSGSKYLGGHSDVLCGVLIVKTKEEWDSLRVDRTYLGSPIGSLESWLLLRSLRTLHLRVVRQSENATILAKWLHEISKTPSGKAYDGVPGGLVLEVFHPSLQGKDERGFEPSQQMEGWNACFSILISDPSAATKLPYTLRFFVAATSLGGVESTIEHRHRSDPNEDPKLIRLSVGVEDVEDLKNDLRQGLIQVANDAVKAKL